MSLNGIESDGKFRFLVLVAEFGEGGIILRHDYPHQDGCQGGDHRSKDIGMPFQMFRYLGTDLDS